MLFREVHTLMQGPRIHKILAKKGKEILRKSKYRAFAGPHTYVSNLTLRATATAGNRPTLMPVRGIGKNFSVLPIIYKHAVKSRQWWTTCGRSNSTLLQRNAQQGNMRWTQYVNLLAPQFRI
jgi:hypothetical protein